MSKNRYKTPLFAIFFFFLFIFFFPGKTTAAVKTSALETVPWKMVAESSIIDEKGWLQSMCATDQYIVCLVNASKKKTNPDTLIAFYRNTTDVDGNPVEQYSYAFHVTEMDYEHGNGMTYNPKTQEIAIAGLFTNDTSNAGAVFIVDANTLKFKRKVQVGNGSINFFGIDYVEEKDQYVLMANRIADYAFYFTDSNFSIVDKINLKLSYSRSSFQDFCVSQDAIISIPYMQREGYMNILDVYSISQQKRIGSYYLTLPGHDAFEVEPEGICQLEPGHFLMASAIIGTTRFRLYEATLPLVHSISTSVENGKITESNLELDEGSSTTIVYGCDEDHRRKSLLVDGEEVDISEYPTAYTFENLQADHKIQAIFEEIPVYTITGSATNGEIEESISGREQESVTVFFEPQEHFVVDTVIVDGEEIAVTSDTAGYTFDHLTKDHTIDVHFKPVPSYTLEISAQDGTVEEPSVTVYRGESYTVTGKADYAYELRAYILDGEKYSLERNQESILLTDIQADHKIVLIYQWSTWVIVTCILICVLILGLLLFFLSIRIRRQKHKKKRKQELQQMRKQDIAFFNEIESLDQKNPSNSVTYLDNDSKIS